VKHGHLRQDPRSRGGKPDKNLPSIRNSLLAADEAKFFQFVHQADGRVMFYLQPLAEISNREPPASGEGFEGEERFVLLGGQVCFQRQGALGEAEKSAQRIAKGSERLVIVGVQLGYHGEMDYRKARKIISRTDTLA